MDPTRRSTDDQTDAPVGVLYAGYQSTHRVLSDERYADRTTAVPVYDLPERDLDRFDAVVVPSVVDQEFLAEWAGQLRSYLAGGGVLVSFAKVFQRWLDGYRWHSHPAPARELHLSFARDHPVFAPVTERDLNWHEGVRGWFTRGYLDTPDGATPVVADDDGRAVVAVDRASTPGTVLATAGADLFHSAFRDHEPFPAVVDRLLDWARARSEVDAGLEPGERR